MEDVLQRLAEVSIRQQQIAEHLATRLGRTEDELAAVRAAAAQRVPLPEPRAQATRLLPKMTADDDVEAFLQVFENTAHRKGWPEDEWARALAPLLTGEAQRAYFSLPLTSADSYIEVKREILARLGLSPVSATQQFHEWEYKPRVPARAQAAELSRIAQHWLLEGNPTPTQVAERVVVDRLLRALPRAHRQAVGMRNPRDVRELVEAIELADAVHHSGAGDRLLPFPRRVVQERRPLEGTARPVSRPTVPPPRDEPMPSAEPLSPPRAWLAGCILHQRVPAGAPEAEVKVDGRRFRALLDSGSAVTLIQSRLCAPRSGRKNFLPITCVHGDTRQVPAREMVISSPQGTWPVEVGLVKDLPVAVLLGRDWPGFEKLLSAATQPASPKGSRRRPRRPPGPRRRPALLASDSGREGEAPSQSTNLFYDVYQQAAGGGSFAKEQREDDRLKHCWSQVRVVDGEDVLPRPHPLPHFVVENGLLYCVAQRRGEEKRLLVVPRAKTETILELAHSHPMAGHLTRAQQAQQRHYDRAAQPREFQPGDRVMVLVPSSACKFLASWKGPYSVVERIGPVTYRLRQPGRRQAEQLYHINLLKKWVGTRDQVAALSLTEPVVVDVNPHLSAAQKTELQHLVSQFQDVFSSQPGQTNVIQHHIRTPPGVIVRQRPYRVPEARRQAIEEEVQQMLKLGVIEPSRSPWSSPIVMVPKPDGTLRFCNDFRRLNEVSEFDGYPMPRVDELLDRLGRARYISTLDLTKGYWQVPLSEAAKPKTAFSTPSGHWQYRTLPFGLHGAPATFQRMMDILLRPHQAYAAAYLDDVVVHSEAWDEHLNRLRRVLSELRRAGLTANPRKCHLALSEAKYLGYQVGRGLIRPQDKKVEAIHPAPRPETKTQKAASDRQPTHFGARQDTHFHLDWHRRARRAHGKHQPAESGSGHFTRHPSLINKPTLRGI
uniref:ribonuclease H n=1 Tax=Cyprinus carpio carpio TaxID=630221 RepID=A0A9J7WWR1_CYPCA